MWDGTSIVDVSDPIHPKTVVFVETTFGTTAGLDGTRNFWRHIKVIGNVMYVGSETSNHGLQAFDLTLIRQVPEPPGDEPEEGFFVKVWLVKIWEFMIWLFNAIKGKIGSFLGFSNDEPPPTPTIPIVSPTYVTPEIGSNHNLVAVPEVGKIIVTGMSSTDKTCPGKNLGTPSATVAALAIFDIFTDPLQPRFERCVDVVGGRGYVHDAHCIKYNGPDTTYKDKMICALFMESLIVLYDLDMLTTINSFKYTTQAYVHQGWFSEDHTTIYVDDELDEARRTTGTDYSTCYIFDVTDLDGPIAAPRTFVTTPSDHHPHIDHNLYTKDGYVYQAAYTAGARVRQISSDKSLEEVAYFDGHLMCECVSPCSCDAFDGTWTYFPYFDSGITIASGGSLGMYILQPTLS